MQTRQAGKENRYENLCEELLRERAAVLTRAGLAVEDALEKLLKIDRQIEEKSWCMQSLKDDTSGQHNLQDGRLILEDINAVIDQFNAARRKAELQYYYLIVTREALGLRRHEMVQQLYPIPSKKKKIQVP